MGARKPHCAWGSWGVAIAVGWVRVCGAMCGVFVSDLLHPDGTAGLLSGCKKKQERRAMCVQLVDRGATREIVSLVYKLPEGMKPTNLVHKMHAEEI